MEHARIDITQGLDGEAVVLACFDLGEEEIAASAHAVQAICSERFRTAEMSVDDVLEMRELTALADELARARARDRHPHARHAPVAAERLADALTHFVESRDEAEWTREEDRDGAAAARSLLWPLGDLCADAMRAALSPRAARAC